MSMTPRGWTIHALAALPARICPALAPRREGPFPSR